MLVPRSLVMAAALLGAAGGCLDDPPAYSPPRAEGEGEGTAEGEGEGTTEGEGEGPAEGEGEGEGQGEGEGEGEGEGAPPCVGECAPAQARACSRPGHAREGSQRCGDDCAWGACEPPDRLTVRFGLLADVFPEEEAGEPARSFGAASCVDFDGDGRQEVVLVTDSAGCQPNADWSACDGGGEGYHLVWWLDVEGGVGRFHHNLVPFLGGEPFQGAGVARDGDSKPWFSVRDSGVTRLAAQQHAERAGGIDWQSGPVHGGGEHQGGLCSGDLDGDGQDDAVYGAGAELRADLSQAGVVSVAMPDGRPLRACGVAGEGGAGVAVFERGLQVHAIAFSWTGEALELGASVQVPASSVNEGRPWGGVQVHVTDFDGDGRSDAFLCADDDDYDAPEIGAILRGGADPPWEVVDPGSIGMSNYPRGHCAVADFDADWDVDVLDRNGTIWWNDGNGHFERENHSEFERDNRTTPMMPLVCELTGDDLPDLVLVHGGWHALSAWRTRDD